MQTLFLDDITAQEKGIDHDKLLGMLSKAPKRKFNYGLFILHTEYYLDELKRIAPKND